MECQVVNNWDGKGSKMISGSDIWAENVAAMMWNIMYYYHYYLFIFFFFFFVFFLFFGTEYRLQSKREMLFLFLFGDKRYTGTLVH